MKTFPHALPLAILFALPGATALSPVALAQTSGDASSTPEISPPASARGQEQDLCDWRNPRDDDERCGLAQNSAHRASGASGVMDPDMMRMPVRMTPVHHRGDKDRGARLHLKRGDSELNISCPAGEHIAACVDAASKLMDRAQSMGSNTTTTRP